jgi:hypothetical protein
MLNTVKTIHGVSFQVKDGKAYRDGVKVLTDRASINWGEGIGDLTHIVFVSEGEEVKGFYYYDPYDSLDKRNARDREARRLAAADREFPCTLEEFQAECAKSGVSLGNGELTGKITWKVFPSLTTEDLTWRVYPAAAKAGFPEVVSYDKGSWMISFYRGVKGEGRSLCEAIADEGSSYNEAYKAFADR